MISIRNIVAKQEVEVIIEYEVKARRGAKPKTYVIKSVLLL